MSSHPHSRSFRPGEDGQQPRARLTASSEGTGPDWADEDKAVLRRLAHAGPGCQHFLIIGFDDSSAVPLPGYEAIAICMGGNVSFEQARFIVARWVEAEQAGQAEAN